MISNKHSVTTGVTKEDLREISTRGYDFYWPVAINGYEWDNEERLAFSYYTSEEGPPFSDSIIPARYNKDALLYEVIIHGRSVYRPPFFGLVPTQQEPIRIHIKRPWLVAKGNIDLQLKQDIRTTPLLKQKIVPTREYQPLSIKTLHRSFAALDTDNPGKEVLSFANKYGLLGRAVGLKIHPKIGNGVVYGESVYLWREEIEKMGILLAIWDLIRQKE